MSRKSWNIAIFTPFSSSNGHWTPRNWGHQLLDLWERNVVPFLSDIGFKLLSPDPSFVGLDTQNIRNVFSWSKVRSAGRSLQHQWLFKCEAMLYVALCIPFSIDGAFPDVQDVFLFQNRWSWGHSVSDFLKDLNYVHKQLLCFAETMTVQIYVEELYSEVAPLSSRLTNSSDCGHNTLWWSEVARFLDSGAVTVVHWYPNKWNDDCR